MIEKGCTVRDVYGNFTGIVIGPTHVENMVRVRVYAKKLKTYKIIYRNVDTLMEVVDQGELEACNEHDIGYHLALGEITRELALNTRDQEWFAQSFGGRAENV